MLDQKGIYTIASELLKKYGSKSGITQHSAELIHNFGKVEFAKIMAAVKHIRDSSQKGKRYLSDSPEKILVKRRLSQLKSKYKEGVRYAFIVKTKKLSPVWSTVEDQYGIKHPVDLPPRFKEGDEISCVVRGFYAKINDKNEAIVNLRLDSPRKLPAKMTMASFVPEEPIQYIKPPEAWAKEVDGLGKHICGKPFTCSCCGRSFPARKGYRIDFREIYFCMDCKREVFRPSGNGWRGRIISTPMGNKR